MPFWSHYGLLTSSFHSGAGGFSRKVSPQKILVCLVASQGVPSIVLDFMRMLLQPSNGSDKLTTRVCGPYGRYTSLDTIS